MKEVISRMQHLLKSNLKMH